LTSLIHTWTHSRRLRFFAPQARARAVDPDDDTDDTQPTTTSSSSHPGGTGRAATFLAGLKWSPRCFSRSAHPPSAFTLPDTVLLEGTDAARTSMAPDVSSAVRRSKVVTGLWAVRYATDSPITVLVVHGT